MEKLPKIHVVLHQMGHNTKKYTQYVQKLQKEIDVHLFYDIIKPQARGRVHPFTREMNMWLNHFLGECVEYYKNGMSAENAVLSTFEEYIK